MPSPRDIEQFRLTLLKLGREEAILADRGEAPPVMDPPPEPTPLEAPAPDAPEAIDDDGSSGDFSALLDGLDLEAPTQPESTGDASLDALLGDLGIDLDADPGELTSDTPDESESSPSDALPDDLANLLSADFSAGSEDVLPAEDESLTGPGEPADTFDSLEALEPLEDAVAPEAPQSGDSDDAGLEALGDFSLDETPGEATAEANDSAFESNIDFDAMDGSAGETLPAPTSEGDEFSVPDFGSASAVAEEPMEESLGFESLEGEFTETPRETPSGLDIPDFGGESLDFGGTKLDASSDDAFADFSMEGDFSSMLGSDGLSSQSIDAQLSGLESGETGNQGSFNLQNAISDTIDFGEFGDFADPGAATAAAAAAKKAQGKTGRPDKPGKAKPKKGSAPQAEPEAEQEGPIELTEEETEKLQDHLLSYHLNLRLAVEEIIAERPVEERHLRRVIRMLVDGAKPEEMARVAGKLVDKRIDIPKGFHKKTAEEFEREKASFAYAFVHNILPILKTVALVGALAGAVAFLGWKFVYVPLRADSLYRAGHASIAAGKYPDAEELFDEAWKTLPVKDWMYRYAEAYAARKNYVGAERKYDQLLERFPFDRKGAMDYVRMESAIQKFESADEKVAKHVLAKDQWSAEGILFQGDNRLAWGDSLADMAEFKDTKKADAEAHVALSREKYESARTSYARLIQRYGMKDLYRARMTRYFVRVGNRREILANKQYWLDSKRAEVDATTLSELAGWLVGNSIIEDVKPLLMRARSIDDTIPETHYEFARYFMAANEPDELLKSLRNAETMFEHAENSTGLRLTGRRLAKYIDTTKWHGKAMLGEITPLDPDGGVLKATEAELKVIKGIERYERALADMTMKRDPSGRFGELYAVRGDIQYYYRTDLGNHLDRALESFDEAERNGYSTRDTDYQRGYVYYFRATSKAEKSEDDLHSALLAFQRAASDFRENERLKYALANTAYLRNDFHLAQGYYLELYNSLKNDLYRLEVIEPQSNPRHNEITSRLLRVTNNLGVTLIRLGGKTGNPSLRSRGMVLLTESSGIFDALSRDGITMERSESKNVAYLNMNGILYPNPVRTDNRLTRNGIYDPSLDFDPQIYLDIDRKPSGDRGEGAVKDPSAIR